jgi:hypothetical protein
MAALVRYLKPGEIWRRADRKQGAQGEMISFRVPFSASARCAIAAGICLMATVAVSRAIASDGWKEAIATIFWVGEASSADNGYIDNLASAWDRRWLESYGGVDDPTNRCGFEPCGFTPKENPFYIALPYNDLTENGTRKTTAAAVPWKARNSRTTALKNRWVAVRANGQTCYGQWQDVGPFESDDFAYVFGDAVAPANKQGAGAGIDLSPALRDCLRIREVSHVSWRHIEAKQVPDGPWRKIVTTRPGP